MLSMACSPAQIVKTEYVKQQVPAPPEEPQYYPVKWQAKDGLYCFDTENAKYLLKDITLKTGREMDMVSILSSFQTGTR